jgi:hypothetical protein
MRAAGDGPRGRWLRGLVVILWRAGRCIQEALALAEADLDYRRVAAKADGAARHVRAQPRPPPRLAAAAQIERRLRDLAG